METGHWKFWVLSISMTLASALLRLEALSQTPFANGWDSYFYLVQVKSWVENGRMHSPEASLIYPLLRFCCWLTGDYVVGYKWCAAALAGAWTGVVWWVGCSARPASISPPILPPVSTPPPAPPPKGRGDASAEGQLPTFFEPTAAAERKPPSHSGEGLGERLTRREGLAVGSTRGSVPLAAAFTLLSPHLTYFAAQYPKNLLGLVLLLAFIGSLPKASTASKRAWIAPLLLLLLNYFGHRLTFALALVYLLSWLFVVFGKNLCQGFFCRKIAWTTLAVTAVLLLAGRFLPGLFQLADLERLSGLGSIGPQFAPWSFVTQFGWGRISGWWIFEIAATVVLLMLSGWRLFLAKNWPTASPHAKALFMLCALLLFPFLEWSFTGAAYRFFLVFVLLSPVLAAGLFVFSKTTDRLLAVALTVCALFSWKSYDPKKHDPDYALFARVTAATQNQLLPATQMLLIAPNALAEFFTYSTGTDALPWLPEYPMPPESLWRIAANMRPTELAYFAPGDSLGEITPLPGRYLLLREDRWQRALAQARIENDADFIERATTWPNPAKVRPGYLLQRKE